MNVNPLEIAGLPTSDFECRMPHPGPPTARAVLEELFLLLEDYAPTWYTEEHHKQAVAALRVLQDARQPTNVEASRSQRAR